MAERLKPWRPKPPAEVVDLIQHVSSSSIRIYLLQRSGPTSFIIREEGSEKKHKVMLGASPSCTCTPGSSSGGCKELCVHILFVMLKVLRVPPSNPLVWQLFLNDRELDEVLRCANAPQAAERKAAKPQPGKPEGEVDRKSLSEEEMCPICYEDMTGADEAELVYCRYSCGNNVHGRCMRIWSDHQAATSQTLTCPLCRGDWGDFKWRPVAIPRRKKPPPSNLSTHFGTKCAGCRAAPIQGKRYRCLVCPDLSLCDGCFQAGQHPQHPMVCKETTASAEAHAEREVMMPSATAIAGSSTSVDAGRRQPGVLGKAAGSTASGPKGRGMPSKASTSRRTGPPRRSDEDTGGNVNARELDLGNLLAVGPAAGLGEDFHPHEDSGAALDGMERAGGAIGLGRSNKVALEPVGDRTGGRVRSGRAHKRVEKSPSFNLNEAAEGPIFPALDVVGGSFGSLKRIAGKPEPVAQHTGPLSRVFPSPAPMVIGKAARRSSVAECSDRAEGSYNHRRSSIDAHQPVQFQDHVTAMHLASQGRKHSKELRKADLGLQSDSPAMDTMLCGHSLGSISKDVDHGLGRDHDAGPPPGEVWGGRGLGRREVLPSIRKGTTMPRQEPRARPDPEILEEVDTSLGGLVIGSKKLLDMERSGLDVSITGGHKQTRRHPPMKGVPNPGRPAPPRPAISCSFRPVLGAPEAQPLVLDGQQTDNSFRNVLDNFFDGPEFDPGDHRQDDEAVLDAGSSMAVPMRSSSMFANPVGIGVTLTSLDFLEEVPVSPRPGEKSSSLPNEYSIPLIITGPGEEDEGVSVVRSPTKRMPTVPRSMPRMGSSVPDSPTRHLPPWVNDDASFDFDEDLYSRSFEQQGDEDLELSNDAF